MRRQILFFLTLLLSCAISHGTEDPGSEATLEETPQTVLRSSSDETENDLSSLLRHLLISNGQIKEAMQDIEIARAELDRARAAFYPQGQGMLLVAPMIGIQGNALNTTYDWSKWGPYVTSTVQIAQPLYSFGQLSAYKKAGESQIVARSEQVKMKRSEMINMAKEMYYGLLMANELEALVDGVITYLDEALETAENLKSQRKKKVTITPHDFYHLQTVQHDLKQKRLQAVVAKKTARRALAWLSSVSVKSILIDSLSPESYERKTLQEYLLLAKRQRPELKALAAGEEARLALRDAKQAQDYPVVFFGVMGMFNWSPVTTKQIPMFAWDPFNRISGGGGLGLKMDFEFKRHAAEAAEQQAEFMKLKATESYANTGIDLQVKRAYWELDQAEKGLSIAGNRKKLAKKWFTSNAMGWSLGIVEPKKLFESLEESSLSQKNYIETVYSFNVALSHLSQAVGSEVSALKY